ncbi:MAG: Ezrin/radixin/moesin family protein [Cytophagales bacterium]|nr:Ezrin/radixin/moesin family protein [Cytophagales bacterium]
MNLKTIATFIIATLCVYATLAQEDKATIKEWEKKKKEMSGLEFMRLVKRSDSLSAALAAKNNSITDLENNVAQKTEEARRATEELANLKNEYENYKNSVNTATEPAKNETDATVTTPEKKEKLYKGVIFKVQIGAFRNKDLIKYFENNKNFSGDVDPDGIKKYTLGYFNDYWEAENFKKYLREMGVRDAWIVPYKDGKRQNIRDVLEGLL